MNNDPTTMQIGMFQGTAPQFIILSVSIIIFIYLDKFNWDIRKEMHSLNISRYSRFGINTHELDYREAGLWVDRIMRYCMHVFMFFNILAICRIFIAYFYSNIPDFFINSIDIIILSYFLFTIFYSKLVHKLIFLKYKEDGVFFTNYKNK